MKRRAFLQWATAVVSGVIAAVIALPGVQFILHPLRGKSSKRHFLRVAPLSSIKPGVPFRAGVQDARRDAYTHHPSGPIGSVWLLREPGDSDQPVIYAFQVICPHLGCALGYAPDFSRFTCPCHASAFDLDGGRISGPSPRDMDELACRLTAPDRDGARWVEVRFETFRSGVVDKTPLA